MRRRRNTKRCAADVAIPSLTDAEWRAAVNRIQVNLSEPDMLGNVRFLGSVDSETGEDLVATVVQGVTV